MLFKKIAAFSACALMLLPLASCKGEENTDSSAESTTAAVAETATDTLSPDAGPVEATALADNGVTRAPEAEVSLADDPSLWSKAMIIEAYKNAAKKSDAGITAEQLITLKEFSVNNDKDSGVMKFVNKIMSTLLANNSKEISGVTGGYENLSEADVKSAKAYKSGGNTVIELVLNEQTDGARSDANSGSVGHAISVVGDIGVVTDQLTDLGLPLEITDKNTTIHYTDAVVKVVIGGDGKIIRGTWSYTVEILLNNYKVGGKTVETTSVILNNVIAANGGFSA